MRVDASTPASSGWNATASKGGDMSTLLGPEGTGVKLRTSGAKPAGMQVLVDGVGCHDTGHPEPAEPLSSLARG